ncbi:MAG: hypothetical protein ABI618_11220 [Nitrospirota bacterium]
MLQITETNAGENFRSQSGEKRQLNNGENFQHLGQDLQRVENFKEKSSSCTSEILDKRKQKMGTLGTKNGADYEM